MGGKIHLEAVDRIGSIPIVEKGFKQAEQLYGKVKNNNRLFCWYFDTAEATIVAAYESVQPAVKLLETPLKHLDTVMCRSLDILEQRMSFVYLPPEMMYWNTKEYMSDNLVKPVLKRADSVKQLGAAVLDSPLTTYAADRIDGAFTVGDILVDKYLGHLPNALEQDQVDGSTEDENIEEVVSGETGAIKAIHHGQRFSRKLKRQLTKRTFAEARALKKQSKEAIHVLLYAAELLATNPKEAYQKTKELWTYLSKDEPENQARPETLEQLIVLIVRESLRIIVHSINFTATLASRLPRTMSHTSMEALHYIIHLMHVSKLDQVKVVSKDGAKSLKNRMFIFYGNFQGLTNNFLERVALFLSGRIDVVKLQPIVLPSESSTVNSLPRRRMQVNDNNSMPESHNNINGIY